MEWQNTKMLKYLHWVLISIRALTAGDNHIMPECPHMRLPAVQLPVVLGLVSMDKTHFPPGWECEVRLRAWGLGPIFEVLDPSSITIHIVSHYFWIIPLQQSLLFCHLGIMPLKQDNQWLRLLQCYSFSFQSHFLLKIVEAMLRAACDGRSPDFWFKP